MNGLTAFYRMMIASAVLAILASSLTGCATQKINWAGRVGNYTFDQAIAELGPPDKQARLQDGTVVAEWLTRRGYPYSYPVYIPWGYYGAVHSTYVDGYSPDYFLRLTFNPDSTLASWKTFAR